MSNSGYKDMFATILAAGTAGKQLAFWMGGCTMGPWGQTAPTVGYTYILF
jgi:hypothetical protein